MGFFMFSEEFFLNPVILIGESPVDERLDTENKKQRRILCQVQGVSRTSCLAPVKYKRIADGDEE